MTLDVLNTEGAKVARLNLDEKVFDGSVKEELFYEVVKMQLASRRSGTASTKTRSEVRGGGAKPWRQKGSGRARAGTRSSPIWRHGGVVFGPKPRDYSYKLPKKVMRAALKSAVQHKINEGKIKIFEALDLAEPRTRLARETFGKAGLSNALLVVDRSGAQDEGGKTRNLELATRNLKGFKVLDVSGINVYDVLRYTELVMTRGAFEKVESMVR
jgi:large subunit ribosomal protein L4